MFRIGDLSSTRSALLRKSFKPAYSCISAIRSYFSSLHSPIPDRELIVGDRIFTDVVLANWMRLQNRPKKGLLRMGEFEKDGTLTSEKEYSGCLSVWSTGVWERESRVMKWVEHGLSFYFSVTGELKCEFTDSSPFSSLSDHMFAERLRFCSRKPSEM